MTYGEIFEEFLTETHIDRQVIEDYRPCCEMFDVPNIANAIVVWLGNGAKIIYISNRKGVNMAIKIGDRVVCITYPAARGTVIKQYYPTAGAEQTMIRCDDGRLFHAPTTDFVKI